MQMARKLLFVQMRASMVVVVLLQKANSLHSFTSKSLKVLLHSCTLLKLPHDDVCADIYSATHNDISCFTRCCTFLYWMYLPFTH